MLSGKCLLDIQVMMQNKQLEFRGAVMAEDKHLEINKLQLDIILREKEKLQLLILGHLKF